MKRREAIFALFGAAALVLALLAVFAIELANTQAKSKRDVEARVHERAVLAAGLIDSLFNTAEQQVPSQLKLYGTATVSRRTMNANRGQDTYVALLDGSGRVLVASRGFTAQARADLPISAALRLVRAGHPYALGNVLPYGRSGVVNLAVVLPTRYGRRILLTGFSPSLLSPFMNADLRQIPGVRGAHNYVIDGNNRVLATTNPQRPVDYVFSQPSEVAALSHLSGDVQGHYYDQVALANSTWRIILAAPDGPLFASVTGLRKWVPWAIFLAFALVASLALLLARRALRASDELRRVNTRLGYLNRELATANEALERRAGELERSNSELEQFASIASHDLQEPLRKVRTFTQQLGEMESDRLSEKGRDYLRRTNAAAERMQGLITDLLKFSRVTTHARPFVPVDLNAIVREVIVDLEYQMDSSHAELHVADLPTIDGDEVQMRQLFQNLLSNALKFRRPDVVPEISIDAVLADGMARITVRDNGIGFDPQYSRRIFRVFERLHGRGEYPGTGIGLALCRKIADRHGGTIVAESSPSDGASFTVTLPLHQRNGTAPAIERAENGAGQRAEAERVLA